MLLTLLLSSCGFTAGADASSQGNESSNSSSVGVQTSLPEDPTQSNSSVKPARQVIEEIRLEDFAGLSEAERKTVQSIVINAEHHSIWNTDVEGIFSAYPDITAVLDFGKRTEIHYDFRIPAEIKKAKIKGDHVTRIGKRFLYNCKMLTELDLSSLSNLTSIEDVFLLGCSGLATLDLSPLSKVTSIGNGFLEGCSRLATLDLSPLSKLTSIGDWFLFGCLRVTDVFLPSNVTSIGDWFLDGDSRVKQRSVHVLEKSITRTTISVYEPAPILLFDGVRKRQVPLNIKFIKQVQGQSSPNQPIYEDA